MKNILKSTASIFVLLGALSNYTPSLAMEEENDKKGLYKAQCIPPECYKISEDLIKILMQSQARHRERKDFEVEQEAYNPETPITMLPQEILQSIFSFFDGPTTERIWNVCKHWRMLSIDLSEKSLLRTELCLKEEQPGNESEQFIEIFTSGHKTLAHQQLLYPTPENRGYDIRIQTVTTDESVVPENVRKFVSAIRTTPYLYSFLCGLYREGIDVLDIPTSSLAGYVISQVSEIKSLLQKGMEDIEFNPTEFSTRAENPENHPQMHQYLMSLKLLTLSGDVKANDKLYAFSFPVMRFLQPRDPSDWKCTHLLNHPLWGAYIQNSNSLNSQWQAIRYNLDIDLSALDAFWRFTSLVTPRVADLVKMNYLANLLKIYDKNGDKDNLTKAVCALSQSELEKFVTRENPFHLDGDPGYISSPVEQIISQGHLVPGISILNQAQKKLENNPHLLKVRLDVARGVFNSLKEKRTPAPEVEEFLQRVEDHDSEKVWAYCSSLEPELENKWKREYLGYLMAGYRKGNKTDFGKMLHSLAISDVKVFLMPPPPGPYLSNHSVFMTNIISDGNYSLANSILEEALKQLGRDDLKTKFYMATCIVGMQDQKKFQKRLSEAESYLQEIFDTYPQLADYQESSNSSDSSSSEESNALEEWERDREVLSENPVQIEEVNQRQDPLKAFFFYDGSVQDMALSTRTALAIYQGKFKEICEGDLKSSFGVNDSVMNALQSQIDNSDLPDGLIRLVGKNQFLEFFEFTPKHKKELDKYDTLRSEVLEEARKYDWFLRAAMERKLIDPALFQEIIELCKSSEETSSSSVEETLSVKASGEDNEKEKGRDN
ncbi:MAG: hypothetical protein BGO67_12195 [Alphaproteobacteria bacterium 41-28]|nr:MAG: hypothetical protein BGO67_12195 [Alphaproteobacteria bacterium 41-28]